MKAGDNLVVRTIRTLMQKGHRRWFTGRELYNAQTTTYSFDMFFAQLENVSSGRVRRASVVRRRNRRGLWEYSLPTEKYLHETYVCENGDGTST